MRSKEGKKTTRLEWCKQFWRYKQFCEQTTAQKTEAISKANALMEQLAADIQMAESEVKIVLLDSDEAGGKRSQPSARDP